MGYVDIHCHILPGLDDGSQDIGSSVAMAAGAAGSGVSAVCATVHSLGYGSDYPRRREVIGPELYVGRLRALRHALRENGIPVKILTGMEVYVDGRFPSDLENGMYFTLGGTKNLLMEFPFGTEPGPVFEAAHIAKRNGYTPVIAHPERYRCVSDEPGISDELAERGCLLQVNKGSFAGSFGERAKEAADYMLDRDIIAAVASDAHSPGPRNASFAGIVRYITERKGPDAADRLLSSGPAAIAGYAARKE